MWLPDLNWIRIRALPSVHRIEQALSQMFALEDATIEEDTVRYRACQLPSMSAQESGDVARNRSVICVGQPPGAQPAPLLNMRRLVECRFG